MKRIARVDHGPVTRGRAVFFVDLDGVRVKIATDASGHGLHAEGRDYDPTFRFRPHYGGGGGDKALREANRPGVAERVIAAAAAAAAAGKVGTK